ncbi:unnamed protein product [Symbiodinium necroappetens]|uniref:Uncharacterized protein n=1 Tax=Symbiodinium necroappetens TaxID=1628268 RepID=A0A812U3I4_9DINO|nr:unnamed protein product [Symbiodinium necroappetens]
MARTTFLLAVVCLAQLGASVRQNMDLASRTLTALHTTEPSPFEEILKEPGMKECGKAIEAVQSHPAHREVFRPEREPQCGLVGTVKCTLSFVGTNLTEPSCCPPACLEPAAFEGFQKLQTIFMCPVPDCKITVSTTG